MTCSQSRQDPLRPDDKPIHDGEPCWTWTCENGAGCGHGHTDSGSPRDREDYASEHMVAHLVGDKTFSVEQGVAYLADLRAGRVENPFKGLTPPTCAMEHFSPADCPHCKLLRSAGFPEMADLAAKGGDPFEKALLSLERPAHERPPLGPTPGAP